MIFEEILTAKEVAQYLKMDIRTIYNLAKAGKIPALKIGHCWRFKKELIDQWITQQCQANNNEKGDGYHE